MIKDMILSQKIANQWQSKLLEEITKPSYYEKDYKSKPISRWKRIKNKLIELTELRLVHKSRIDNEDW